MKKKSVVFITFIALFLFASCSLEPTSSDLPEPEPYETKVSNTTVDFSFGKSMKTSGSKTFELDEEQNKKLENIVMGLQDTEQTTYGEMSNLQHEMDEEYNGIPPLHFRSVNSFGETNFNLFMDPVKITEKGTEEDIPIIHIQDSYHKEMIYLVKKDSTVMKNLQEFLDTLPLEKDYSVTKSLSKR